MADFTHLQTAEMVSAKKRGDLVPLLLHAWWHGCLMMLVVILFDFAPIAPYVFLFQTFAHFCIDALKAKMNVWFPQYAEPSNVYHWYIFGLDQLLHQVVIILITLYIAQ